MLYDTSSLRYASYMTFINLYTVDIMYTNGILYISVIFFPQLKAKNSLELLLRCRHSLSFMVWVP